ERQARAALDDETRPSRQPVVGVDDVDRRQVGEQTQSPLGETAHQPDEAVGGEGTGRACIDVVDDVPGDHRHLVRQLRVVAAGEHVDCDAGGGHAAGEL